MSRPKLPRKSTTVDMTAMCDVAFLLLTFFILATKQKPPEVLTITPPSSVSAVAVPDKSIIITLTKDGRTFLMFGENTKKDETLENLNLTQGMNLTASELTKWKKQLFYGLPLNQVKSGLGMELDPAKMPGIPTDSAKNELTTWLRSITNVYAGGDQRKLEETLLVKGDNDALYPGFKQIKQAFKNNQLYKFRIVTNGEPVPLGSELYLRSQQK